MKNKTKIILGLSASLLAAGSISIAHSVNEHDHSHNHSHEHSHNHSHDHGHDHSHLTDEEHDRLHAREHAIEDTALFEKAFGVILTEEQREEMIEAKTERSLGLHRATSAEEEAPYLEAFNKRFNEILTEEQKLIMMENM